MERTYIKDVTPGVCRVQGFVENFRNKRTMAFIVVRDITGKLQITIEKEKHPEFSEMLDQLTIHSVVTFEGEVVASEYVKMGGKEMYPDFMRIESVAEALPIKDDSDIDVRMDFRWIDLRREKNQLMYEMQTTLTNAMRKFLVDRNFIRALTYLRLSISMALHTLHSRPSSISRWLWHRDLSVSSRQALYSEQRSLTPISTLPSSQALTLNSPISTPLRT